MTMVDDTAIGGWTFSATAFSWTQEVIRAQRPAVEIITGIVTDGITDTIELEPGLMWRSFPEPSDAEVDDFSASLRASGGTVSMIGASIDDWTPDRSRRSDDERLAFLRPQLEAAHRVGARGARLPLGQAGAGLLQRVLPMLEELDLVLYEEVQGQQAPSVPAVAAALEVLADLDSDRLRVLVDTSMLMPAIPTSYLLELEKAHVPADLLRRLRDEWLDPATLDAVRAAVRQPDIDPASRPLYLNLLSRFGRSRATELRETLPLVGAFHLKFWDLDDSDGAVSGPLRDLGVLLRASGFSGTLCSEWGGQEWLADDDASDMTVRHLALARAALSGER